MEEEMKMQQLRSKATEFLLREDWNGSIQAYSHFITLCQDQISNTHQKNNHPDNDSLSNIQKSLCLALSNRAESWSRLKEFEQALKDCEQALQIDNTHFKTLVCKGENEDDLLVPDISLFKPETEGGNFPNENLDVDKILSILDVNSLVEDAVSAKVLGRDGDYYGVGLWLLPSFINHSCSPNARRLHIGDYVLVLASREVKAGEEITFAYYDVLSPLSKRKEMEKTWGFQCECKRCKYEKEMQSKPDIKEIEVGLEGGLDVGCAIFRLEEYMKRWVVRGKEKGYFRASFWKAFSEAYQSEKTARRWGRRIPALEPVFESIVEAVGNDERVLKVFIRKLKRSGGGFGEMERAIKSGRGVYGKIVKKQAMRILLELGIQD